MSELKSVNDFLRAVPQALRHEEVYLEKLKDAEKKNMYKDIDMVEFEKSTVGVGELNILAGLKCSDKFIYPGMDQKVDFETHSFSKQLNKDVHAKGSQTCKDGRSETYLLEKSIQMDRSVGLVMLPNPGITLPYNSSIYARLEAAVGGLAIRDLASIGSKVVGETLTVKSDLKHLFLKGYLMLMSYNLAIVSGEKKAKHKKFEVVVADASIDSMLIAVLLTKKIVADADSLTTEEFWVLSEMAMEYPARRYGSQNIYNGIRLAADDLTMYTRKSRFSVPEDPGFGSPERLWKIIVSLAVKFEALEDLREVIKNMRGMPGMMREVQKFTGNSRFMIKYPESHSQYLAIYPSSAARHRVVRNSNYYATTKCLLVDLMVSKMMIMSTFNLVENFGVLGDIGCPTGNPRTDTMFNSNMRSISLRSECEDENVLLQEWRGIRQGECAVSFHGKLKEYAVKFAQKLRNKEIDFLWPQMIYDLPYSKFKSTTWATVKGWDTESFNFNATADSRVKYDCLTRAYAWVMGAGKVLPRVGSNGIGERNVSVLTAKESEFFMLAKGKYEIGLMNYRLMGEESARMDEMEISANAFYSSNFPGTRCCVVNDPGEGVILKSIPALGDMEMRSTMEFKGSETEALQKTLRHLTYGGGKVNMDVRKQMTQDEVSNVLGRETGDGGSKDKDPAAAGTSGRKEPPSAPPPIPNRGRGAPPKAPPTAPRKKSASEKPKETPVAPATGQSKSGKSWADMADDEDNVGKDGKKLPREFGTEAPGTVNANADTEAGKENEEEQRNVNAKTYSSVAKQGIQQGVPEGESVVRPQWAKAGVDLEEEFIKEMGVGKEESVSGHSLEEWLKVWKELEDPESEKVIMAERAAMPISFNRRVYMDKQGRVIRPQFKTSRGNIIRLLKDPNKDVIQPGSLLRGYTLLSKGDGSCGIHSVAQSLAAYGYVDPRSIVDGGVSETLRNYVYNDSWHEANELAALCNYHGFGMQVLDFNTGVIHYFGTEGARGIITLKMKYNHFDAFVPDERGDAAWEVPFGEVISKTPVRSLINLCRFAKYFGAVSNIDYVRMLKYGRVAFPPVPNDKRDTIMHMKNAPTGEYTKRNKKYPGFRRADDTSQLKNPPTKRSDNARSKTGVSGSKGKEGVGDGKKDADGGENADEISASNTGEEPKEDEPNYNPENPFRARKNGEGGDGNGDENKGSGEGKE